jgi:uncharacterized protein (TIGR02757 family)
MENGMEPLKQYLEDCYACYNSREFVRGDPVLFLHEHEDSREREVVGLIASCLAYGRVESIKASARDMLGRLGGQPRRFLLRADRSRLRSACRGFRHRFTGESEMVALLCGVRVMLLRRGSLEAGFEAHQGAGDRTVVPGLKGFVSELAGARRGIPHLLPSPRGGSACKRLFLFMRWMVRRDEVDPGGWTCVSPDRLVVPLDVHMRRVCAALGFTRRRQADLKAALEVTAAFQELCPADPVRYDFALTRLSLYEGIEGLRERAGAAGQS